MKGTPDRLEPTRQPYQFQSQLWLGSVFHRGGMTPSIPQATSKSPDFLLPLANAWVGLEVKRPQSRESIARKFWEAAGSFKNLVVQVVSPWMSLIA
jgi:hypothetical protein